MTKYEFLRWLTFSIMPTHLVTVRNDIKRLVKTAHPSKKKLSILDVGGRKSPYTINISADVTLLDIPQESRAREDLNLGFTEGMLSSIQQKRTNISDIIVQDMTKSKLPDASFDAVVCVEVIEHVEQDDIFVKNISKVVKSRGWAYFTTPNGDYIKNEGPNKNPDHVRHYKKKELKAILEKYFKNVEVYYAVRTGKHRVRGLRSYKLNRPIKTLSSIVSNLINRIESKSVKKTAMKTAHLVAIAHK